ncbi:MAG: hypothetical protein ACK5LG_22140 [Bacteroides thetaiotaomicron]
MEIEENFRAIDTLGMLHFRTEKRDSVQLAVEPVRAGEYLEPGDRVGIINGVAFQAGSGAPGSKVPFHGVVDPFLMGSVDAGQRFWLIIHPREHLSIRFSWSHPGFPES